MEHINPSFALAVVFLMLFSGCVLSPEQNQTVTCSATYDPVCGVDGKTYTNACFARLEGVPVISAGRCGAGCTDSDEGDVLEVKGTVEAGGSTFTDRCANSSAIIEYSCSDDSIVNRTLECRSGVCEDGQCKALSCADSDNGPDPQTFGSVSMGMQVYNDTCVDPGHVNEFYCETGGLKSKVLECVPGAQCVDGRCLLQEQACSDTDSGKDSSMKGTVKVTKGNETLGEATDSCANSASVREYYCAGKNFTSEVISCPSDSTCADGVCISNQCTDSDGGRMPLTVGTTVKSPQSETDTCQDAGTVKEYYCLNNSVAFSLEPCPSGYECENGKCVGAGCEDSDGGRDTVAFGIIRIGLDIYSDSCVDGYTVKEYFCEDDAISSEEIVCPVGEVCEDGKCGSSEPDCFDSDGGLNLQRGTVTKGSESFTDYCDEFGLLFEYYCQGKTVRVGDFECPDGSVCSNGACVPG